MIKDYFRKALLITAICCVPLGGGFMPSIQAAEYSIAQQQKVRITGVVVDAANEPVIGANILEKGTTNGTITDLDGRFALEVQKGATLVVTFIGYKDQEIIIGNQTEFAITMVDDNQILDDVVVVGYAVGNKRSVSGAVERVTKEQMNVGFVATPIDAIRSRVSGLSISQNGGDPTGTPTIRLRGTSSLTGETGPLIVIDGFPGGISVPSI